MGVRQLMTGNEAIAEAAIRAGCRYYFGYPITPQNELATYMAVELPKVGGTFIQAESEIASINMVYGAAAAGVCPMTASSSPGISLMQEGISYLAGAELPCVYANIARGGPGLANVAPAQSDYLQSVRGGGHGDYRVIVLAPNSVQEMADLTMMAFYLADRYRNPAMILADGVLGLMMEPVEVKDPSLPPLPEKEWTVGHMKERGRKNLVTSLFLGEGKLEAHNRDLQAKYRQIETDEVRYEEVDTQDAELVLVAYGTSARVAQGAMEMARSRGLKVGMLRPITLWPFPTKEIQKIGRRTGKILVVEMSMGQLVEDVRLAVGERCEVHLHARCGGGIPTSREVFVDMEHLLRHSSSRRGRVPSFSGLKVQRRTVGIGDSVQKA